MMGENALKKALTNVNSTEIEIKSLILKKP